MAAPSKNQRSGKKSAPPAAIVCHKGHVKTWCHVAARGRKNMVPLCECDGYTPIALKKQS